MGTPDLGVLTRHWDMSPDLLAIADNQGRFLEVNPAFTRVLGWSEEELEGKPFLDFVHSDDRDATLDEARRLADGGGSAHFENRYRCKDGSWRWLAWRSEPAGGEIFAVARDVTELKRLQADAAERAKAEAKAEAMGEVAKQQRLILNAASHELNTPITPIVLALAEMQARSDDPKQLAAVERVQRNVRKLQATITSLLHVSQLATERLRIRTGRVPVAPMLQRLETDAPIEAPRDLLAYGDAALLEHAVGALVRNAEQHGGGVTGLDARPVDGMVRIRVKDEGPGFEGHDGEPWFLPLNRGESTQTRPGAGLGLTLVRLVATAHGGTAGLESAGRGQGTTAWLTVPRADAA